MYFMAMAQLLFGRTSRCGHFPAHIKLSSGRRKKNATNFSAWIHWQIIGHVREWTNEWIWMWMRTRVIRRLDPKLGMWIYNPTVGSAKMEQDERTSTTTPWLTISVSGSCTLTYDASHSSFVACRLSSVQRPFVQPSNFYSLILLTFNDDFHSWTAVRTFILTVAVVEIKPWIPRQASDMDGPIGILIDKLFDWIVGLALQISMCEFPPTRTYV